MSVAIRSITCRVSFVRLIAVLLASSLGVSACTEVNRLSPTDTKSLGRDAVFVLGLAPSNYKILIFSGSIQDGLWHQNPWASATFLGTAKDGYVIAKASPGETYAITAVVFLDSQGSGTAYNACDSVETVVFTVPAGKVVYLTNLQLGLEGTQMKLRYSNDLGKAKEYVDGHYPALMARTELGTFEFRKTDAQCGADRAHVPVYIPVGR